MGTHDSKLIAGLGGSLRGIKKEQEKKRTSNEDMPQVAKLKDKVDYQAGSVVSRKFIDKMHMFLCL